MFYDNIYFLCHKQPDSGFSFLQKLQNTDWIFP